MLEGWSKEVSMNKDAEAVRKRKEKAVIVLSGGLDSSTMLFMLFQAGFDVFPLSFRYGQKHMEKEIVCAGVMTEILGLRERHRIIDIRDVGRLFETSALTAKEIEVPMIKDIQSKTQAVLKSTVVPFRNAIFLSIAIGYAQSIHAHNVFYAAHASDFATYPDCRPNFISAFNKAAIVGTEDNDMRIASPFVATRKEEIVIMGNKMGVPFELTWSCYRGGDRHCGYCPSCLERKHAFKEAKVKDPTQYA